VGAALPARTLTLGSSIIPDADSLAQNRELVRVVDDGGLALVGIQDHPYQRHFLDTWSLIATLLSETTRVSFFTDVASLPLRPPAVLAKAAASLDVLGGGRFELGLGAGGLPDLIANFGGVRRTPGESVEALEEAIEVIRLLWSERRSVSFDGKHYRLNDARPGPSAVLTNTSVTLEETGIAAAINEGGAYESVRKKMLALDFATQAQEMKAIAGQPDFALGSVHAVTREGVLVIASASGSQLGSYAWGAASVIFVVGAQKLVPTLEARANGSWSTA